MKSQEIRTWVNTEEVTKYFPENVDKFYKAIRSGKRIWDIQQEIKSGNEFYKLVKDYPNYNICFLPKSVEIKSVDYLIYDEGIAMIQAGEKTLGIAIKNSLLKENAKTMYDLLWNFLAKI